MKNIYLALALLAAALSALADGAPASCGANFTLYNVMPYSPDREEQCAADSREYMDRTGCDLVLYCLTLHPEGKPAMEKVERYVASFRKFKAALADSKVRAGNRLFRIGPSSHEPVERWKSMATEGV